MGGSVRIRTCDLELPNNHQNYPQPQSSSVTIAQNNHMVPSHPPPAVPHGPAEAGVATGERAGSASVNTGATGGSASGVDGGRAVENQYSFV